MLSALKTRGAALAVLGLLVVAAVVWLSTREADEAGYVAPPTASGHPDLSGVWQARTTANWDLESHAGALNLPAGFSVVVDPADGRIPYREDAMAWREEHFARREQDDPMSKCYLAGVPRTMYVPHPFQIFQTDEEVVILSEYVHTWRWIPTAPLDRYPGYESWMGDPRGRWEGETLVVETTGFNAETWLDHSGNYHSDALSVVERFTRTAPDVITYEATIDDPMVFTRAWTIRLPLHRQADRDQVLEYECYLYAADAGRRIIGSHPDLP